MVDSVLPDGITSRGLDLTKGDIERLVLDSVEKDPESYKRVMEGIKDLGFSASLSEGITLGVEDLDPGFDKDEILREMDLRVAAEPDRKMDIWMETVDKLTDATMEHGRRRGTDLAAMILSGARGNPSQYRAMVATPGIYTDYEDKPIPLFVRRSFGEGIRPIDMLASTFGTRKAVLATKRSTADAGDLGKMLASSASHLTVGDMEPQNPDREFIVLSTDDDSLRGRVLAEDFHGFNRGTVIAPHVEDRIRDFHGERVRVYSPLAEQTTESISGYAYGQSYSGHLPGRGFMAGATSGNALGEPLAQSGLNTKHLGGAFTGKKRVFSGFDYVSQFVQVPDAFRDKATVAESPGTVERIEDADHGGKYVYVDGVEYYTLPGLEPSVKPGDHVEAGDALSEGLVNPRDIVRLRGLGEGRRYWARRLQQLFNDSGIQTSRRHTEVLARAILDSVKITDPEGYHGYEPDTVTSYTRLAQQWEPREESRKIQTSSPEAPGMYLEEPVLHYTIGTPLSTTMLKEIEDAGIPRIRVHHEPPPWEPILIRLRTSAGDTMDDWLARMNTSYLKRGLQDSGERGLDTNVRENRNPFPRMAYGEGFGENTHETGKF